jgi:hypothetical protein
MMITFHCIACKKSPQKVVFRKVEGYCGTKMEYWNTGGKKRGKAEEHHREQDAVRDCAKEEDLVPPISCISYSAKH